MTPPIVPERGVPLTAETVGLLQPGDWLLRDDGEFVQFVEPQDSATPGRFLYVLPEKGRGGGPAHRFTFLGRPDADGWMRATGTAPTRANWAIEVRRDGKSWTTNAEVFNWDLWCEWRPQVVATPALSTADTVVVPVAVLNEAAGILDCEGYGPLSLSLLSCLSAPAREPEGGAALDAATVALEWVMVKTTAREEWRAEFGDYVAIVVLGHDNEWSYRVNNSGHLGFASADEAKAQALSALRKRLSARLNDARATVALYDAALTPKEAPAAPTCQKCGGEVQGWTCQGCGASFRESDGGALVFNHEAPAATGAGERELIARTIRRAVGDAWIGEHQAEVAADAVLALRAQPQAREEAQPVAWTGSGSLARIQGKGAGFQGYIYGTPDDAHPIALYTSQPLAEGADAEKLRVAVEALKPFVAEAERIRAPYSAETIMDNVELWQCGSVEITRTRLTYGDLRRAHKALAALQQEGNP